MQMLKQGQVGVGPSFGVVLTQPWAQWGQNRMPELGYILPSFLPRLSISQSLPLYFCVCVYPKM